MTLTALIVDDSLTVRMDLGEAFEEANFTVHLCDSLGSARKLLERSPVDVIVLDVILPDGDGFQLLSELKANERTAKTPVLLLSSRNEVRDRVQGLKIGADEYVGKPYDRFYVVARAKELLRKTEQSRPDQAPLVLIIDDSLTFREELKQGIEQGGYRATTAVSGEDGLRAAEQVRPAAIIVDGIMPGIDGATVVRRIRQDAALRRTPCILLTASEDMADELRALDAGADAYVRKDDGNTVILAKLMAILRSVGAPATHDSTASLFGPKKVLAVDDSPTYLNSISEQLRAEGYGVVLARSGEEALELLAAQSVDCILLDLLMPGLSGEETCRRIKNSPEWRDIPLLILTAREERESMIEGINAGADDYISKSSDPAVLSARLRAQLRRRQFEDENRNIHEELLKKELEARAAQTLAQARAELMGQIEQKNRDLEYANRELEAFCYSVSHDLRAPLRTIDSFSRLLIEDHLATLDDAAQSHLKRIRRATERMSDLIDDMLELSNASRGIMLRESLDLSPVAQEVAAELQAPFSPGTPGATRRDVTFHIEPNLEAYGDWRLLRVLFENLLGNAWKFTQKRDKANIWVGRERRTDSDAFFVRDDGAGFDMAYAQKLFQPFSRLHNQDEFEGTGIGLATVQRIISRHGGRVWAESGPEGGATFWFTLPKGAIPA